MDFCCSQCGNRQDRDAVCVRCGWDTVHDLRSRRTRDLLDDIELRLRDRTEGRTRMVGVVAGMAIVVGLWLMPGYWSLRGAAYPGLPLLADQIILMAILGYAVQRVLEKKLTRPRFPYLASLPPPDRS
jgi:hypothetical protein